MKTNAIEPIRNPDFQKVLLDNASCGYCMSHQYELVKYWYLPTFCEITDWVRSCVKNNIKTDFTKARADIIKKRIELHDKTMSTPLANMAPALTQTYDNFVAIMKKMEKNAKIIVEK